MGTPPSTRWTLKNRPAPADYEAARWPAVVEDQAGRYVGSFFVAAAADVPTVVAAPELLEACRTVLAIGELLDAPDDANQRIYLGQKTIATLRAVVAKATGGVP